MNKVERIRINGVDYPYDKTIREGMELNGITQVIMRERIKKGWTLYQAVNAPKGMSLKEFKKREQQKLKSRREYLEYQMLKDKKPHLFDGTPQQHSRGKYVSSDMKHRTIARIKTDIYGNVQLI